jgi:hypothetical protein
VVAGGVTFAKSLTPPDVINNHLFYKALFKNTKGAIGVILFLGYAVLFLLLIYFFDIDYLLIFIPLKSLRVATELLAPLLLILIDVAYKS